MMPMMPMMPMGQGQGQGSVPEGHIMTLMPNGQLVPMPIMTGQIFDPESLKPGVPQEEGQAVSEVLS